MDAQPTTQAARTCTQCGETKPLAYFYGQHPLCQTCITANYKSQPLTVQPTLPATKTCKRCEVTKPLTAFARRRIERDGLHFRCRKCEKVTRKAKEAKKRATANVGRTPQVTTPKASVAELTARALANRRSGHDPAHEPQLRTRCPGCGEAKALQWGRDRCAECRALDGASRDATTNVPDAAAERSWYYRRAQEGRPVRTSPPKLEATA